MKILNTEQIRAWDAFTIKEESIRSADLMNRAAQAFSHWFASIYTDTNQPVYIFAGTGNNGGDGIAVARILHYLFYEVKVFVCAYGGKHAPDFDVQMKTLPLRGSVSVTFLQEEMPFPQMPRNAVVIDALFGSGLSRVPEGAWARVIEFLNALHNDVVSIDLPSGLFADRHTPGPCVRAARTFCFELPRLAFFFRENAEYLGQWSYGSIGLLPKFLQNVTTPYYMLQADGVKALVHARPKFGHKGNFGHALLLAGSRGKIGAAILAARGALRSGAGLLTVYAPACGYTPLQTAVPEAMVLCDPREDFCSETPDPAPFSAIGVGPGIGTAPETAGALETLLSGATRPLVLDADALNLLAAHQHLWRKLPRNSVLTPHPGEFVRLFGKTTDDFEQLDLLRRKAEEHGVFIVLKGAHSIIACPDGACYFNSSGNPGMATGGSGDVLTGILTGLLAQGYAPLDAVRIGVFLHGMAGDLAAAEHGQAGLTAGDLPEYLARAWRAWGM